MHLVRRMTCAVTRASRPAALLYPRGTLSVALRGAWIRLRARRLRLWRTRRCRILGVRASGRSTSRSCMTPHDELRDAPLRAGPYDSSRTAGGPMILEMRVRLGGCWAEFGAGAENR